MKGLIMADTNTKKTNIFNFLTDNFELFEDVDFWQDTEGCKKIAATNDGNSSMKYF